MFWGCRPSWRGTNSLRLFDAPNIPAPEKFVFTTISRRLLIVLIALYSSLTSRRQTVSVLLKTQKVLLRFQMRLNRLRLLSSRLICSEGSGGVVLEEDEHDSSASSPPPLLRDRTLLAAVCKAFCCSLPGGSPNVHSANSARRNFRRFQERLQPQPKNGWCLGSVGVPEEGCHSRS